MTGSALTQRILREMKADGFALSLEPKPLPAGATILVHHDPKAELHRRFRAESGGDVLLTSVSATALLGVLERQYPGVQVSLADRTTPNEDLKS